MKAATAIVLILACGGCAVRRSTSYRLAMRDAGAILIPPGVGTPDVTKRRFAWRASSVRGPCSSAAGVIEVQDRKNRIVLSVMRDALAKQPGGWLSDWTAQLEAQGCLGPGEGLKLAEHIAESLPLELNAAFRLLHGSEVDVGPWTRLEVVSPVFREGTSSTAPVLDTAGTTGNGNTLTVTVRGSADLMGFETAWYGVRPRASGAGFSIVPLRAERNIQGKVEPLAGPVQNSFAFPADAAFYRLFYKANQTEFTALAVAARTRAELGERTKILEAGTASCKKLNNELCVAIPKGVAVNAYVSVTVNGREVPVLWPGTVRAAIEAAGEDHAETGLTRLVLHKLYGGRPAVVEFDRARTAVLDMILTGGESMVWR